MEINKRHLLINLSQGLIWLGKKGVSGMKHFYWVQPIF